MMEEAVHLAPGHPRGEAALDTSHFEVVPVSRNVHLDKDQSRNHSLVACSLHQGEGNPASHLALVGQASLLCLLKSEARKHFKHLQR